MDSSALYTFPISPKTKYYSRDPSLDEYIEEDHDDDDPEVAVFVQKHRVCIMGQNDVGKTALVNQFLTSEYMNTYDASLGK